MNKTSLLGSMLGMGKRIITEKQETALKLCHHDFGGLSQAEAAKRMNISQSALSGLLARVKKVMPQYFPILTKLEAKCYHWYVNEGWPVSEIAECTGQSEDAIYKTLKRTKDKGMCFSKPKGRILQYDPNMDAKIKQQF